MAEDGPLAVIEAIKQAKAAFLDGIEKSKERMDSDQSAKMAQMKQARDEEEDAAHAHVDVPLTSSEIQEIEQIAQTKDAYIGRIEDMKSSIAKIEEDIALIEKNSEKEDIHETLRLYKAIAPARVINESPVRAIVGYGTPETTKIITVSKSPSDYSRLWSDLSSLRSLATNRGDI